MKKIIILLVAIVLSGVLFYSCKENQVEPTESPPDISQPGVFEITVNRPPFLDANQSTPFNLLVNYDSWNKIIEEKYNISIKIVDVPILYASSIITASYYPIAIEENKISGLIELNYHDFANIAALKDRGLILPLDQFLKNNEAYQSLPASMTDAFIFADGQTWALSASTPTGIYSRKLRKEWLTELDLLIPENLNELYEVAKAFAYNDPNGNGIPDEHGMDIYHTRGSQYLRDIFIAFNCYLSNYGWSSIAYDYSTDSYEDAMLKPEMKEALTYIKNLRDEGILHSNSDWGYTSSDSKVNGNYYSESARSNSEDLNVWAIVNTFSTTGNRSVLVRGPEKCYVLAANTPNPEFTINGFVSAFYIDVEGMLTGAYGEENINYTVDGNLITNSFNGQMQETYLYNISLIQPNFQMLLDQGYKLDDSRFGGVKPTTGKMENLELLNKYYIEKATIVDNWMPIHSDYKKVQLSFGNAINNFILNSDTIDVDDFIENYINNAKKSGNQKILDDLNGEKNAFPIHNY